MPETGFDGAERVARESYGRLLAALVARTRDIAAAEDALSEAFVSALSTWSRDGVPENPEAWLLTAARRKFIDVVRHKKVEQRGRRLVGQTAALESLLREAEAQVIADDRLNLLFLCAHPAVHVAVRAPLMLQSVLGVDAERIASAFLVAPSTLAQRLVRAKRRIKQTGIRFELPPADAFLKRLDDVLATIYVAYTVGWRDPIRRNPSLADEALWLAEQLVDFVPEEPEALGLLALLCFSQSRAAFHADASLAYVPVSEQNTARWDQTMISRGESLLKKASAMMKPGRFQIEAAIQSVHADRIRTGQVEWSAIVILYDQLTVLAPSIGARIARAAAMIEVGRSAQALLALDELPEARVAVHQPYWATRAAVLESLGRLSDESSHRSPNHPERCASR